MFRPVSRSVLRATQSSLSPARTTAGRRLISTEPPHLRSRSWKSSALRWGIAIAGIYYYNTSSVFAEQPQSSAVTSFASTVFSNANPWSDLLNPNLDALDDSSGTSSLDALTSRRSRQAEKNAQVLHSAADAVSSENASTSANGQPGNPLDTASPAAAELEEEAEGEGAFNPETGEINWDCPCLGGMAHGPCGPEFREAFSCFVFSKEEPKGMDCIEKFQGMRDCFQQHPDVYKDELMEDEEIDRELEAERQELAQQIAERQKADGNSGRRLLEEPAPEPRPARSPKTRKERSSESASTTSSSEEATPNPTRSAIEGKGSTTPPIPVATTATLSSDDVVPEIARDATDAVVPSDRKTKS